MDGLVRLSNITSYIKHLSLKIVFGVQYINCAFLINKADTRQLRIWFARKKDINKELTTEEEKNFRQEIHNFKESTLLPRKTKS